MKVVSQSFALVRFHSNLNFLSLSVLSLSILSFSLLNIYVYFFLLFFFSSILYLLLFVLILFLFLLLFHFFCIVESRRGSIEIRKGSLISGFPFRKLEKESFSEESTLETMYDPSGVSSPGEAIDVLFRRYVLYIL